MRFFRFDVPENGAITFKIWFNEGILPEVWPAERVKLRRSKNDGGKAPKEKQVPATVELRYGVTPSREEVLAHRKQYDAGTIVELIDMQDEWSNLRPGDSGTVQYVDDAGQIQMRWRRGSWLALIPGVDSFRIIGHEEHI